MFFNLINDLKLRHHPKFGMCKLSLISMRTIRYQHVHGFHAPLKRTNDHDEGVFRSLYELYVSHSVFSTKALQLRCCGRIVQMSSSVQSRSLLIDSIYQGNLSEELISHFPLKLPPISILERVWLECLQSMQAFHTAV